jgi:hypothetical protein
MKKDEAIAVVSQQTTALDALNQELDDQASGFNPEVVRVGVLRGAGEFQIPGLPSQSRLEGIILASMMPRILFPKFSNDADTDAVNELTGNRPFCSSRDYVHGMLADVDFGQLKLDSAAYLLKEKIAQGGLECTKCPMQAWGSMEYLGHASQGKACKETRRLLFWKSGMTVPVVVNVPPSSIRAWDSYCSALEASGFRHNRVITEMSLEVKQSPRRKEIVWSVFKFRKAGDITEEMANELVSNVMFRGGSISLVKALVALFRNREVEIEDYTNGHSEDDL